MCAPSFWPVKEMSKEELGFLQAVVGSVKQSQDPAELKYNLNRLKRAYEDVVHGPQSSRGGSAGADSGGWTDLGGGVRIREKR